MALLPLVPGRTLPQQLVDQAKFFESMRKDAVARGLLLAAFVYGLSALRFYAEALEAIAIERRQRLSDA